MPIVYPLTPPAGNRFTVTVRQIDVVALSVSPFTLQQQAQAHAGAGWAIDLVLVPMRRDEFAAWSAFLAALRGRLGTFSLGDPSATSPRGTGAGSPQVAGAGQSGQTLLTDGWAASQTVLRAGDYLQLGSGAQQRLYMVLEDVVSDGVGAATLSIWPALRESPADNDPLILTNTAGTFRLAENTRGWTVDRALIGGFELQAVEAL